MLKRCIVCHHEFGPNERLEHLPVASRVAFDPQRGRLWCICSACQSWTIVPFEQRWEALDELERLTRTRARLLVQGENIALLRAEGLDIVRMGRAGLPEEAWWRYGGEMMRRREHASRVVRNGRIGYSIWLLLFGLPVFRGWDAAAWVDRSRRRSFGRVAWRGRLFCERCGRSITQLKFDEHNAVALSGSAEQPALAVPCACSASAGAHLAGPAATHLLRRLLAYHNHAGAARHEVKQAAARIEDAGSAARLLDRMLERRPWLAAFGPAETLALEIALNDDVERSLLQLELTALDARWREEEQIAAIVDGELT